jgi:hypothetical protein
VHYSLPEASHIFMSLLICYSKLVYRYDPFLVVPTPSPAPSTYCSCHSVKFCLMRLLSLHTGRYGLIPTSNASIHVLNNPALTKHAVINVVELNIFIVPKSKWGRERTKEEDGHCVSVRLPNDKSNARNYRQTASSTSISTPSICVYIYTYMFRLNRHCVVFTVSSLNRF